MVAEFKGIPFIHRPVKWPKGKVEKDASRSIIFSSFFIQVQSKRQHEICLATSINL